MKKLKYQIFLVLLFMAIGIAAVSSNLVVNGTANISGNLDDFSVYFSDVMVDGVRDLSLVKNDKKLVFDVELEDLGDRVDVSYSITNASKNYDASIDVECTSSTQYLNIYNDFDSEDYLEARQTRTGVLSIILSKSYNGTVLMNEISCTINVEAVERVNINSNGVSDPVYNEFYVGREVSISDEKFNIIDSDSTTVSMLAQYNITVTEPFRQSEEQVREGFSTDIGWDYEYAKEIDLWVWSSYISPSLDNYLVYLKGQLSTSDVSINLITLRELYNLGCSVPLDYALAKDKWPCSSSPYADWLINGQNWWTRSAASDSKSGILLVDTDGNVKRQHYIMTGGVRPVITVSKEVAEQLLGL